MLQIEADTTIGSVSIEEVDVEDGNRVDFQHSECGLCRHKLRALLCVCECSLNRQRSNLYLFINFNFVLILNLVRKQSEIRGVFVELHSLNPT